MEKTHTDTFLSVSQSFLILAHKVRERLRVALERVTLLEDQLQASAQEVKAMRDTYV